MMKCLLPTTVPRPQYKQLYHRLLELTPAELEERQGSADLHSCIRVLRSRSTAIRPRYRTHLSLRPAPARRHRRGIRCSIEHGLIQRITALNLFLHDIYHKRRILADKVVPHELVFSSKHYRREMNDLDVPHGVYVAVTGTDLIRGPDGKFVVLEDNLRVPSGASYMLANRQVIKTCFCPISSASTACAPSTTMARHCSRRCGIFLQAASQAKALHARKILTLC